MKKLLQFIIAIIFSFSAESQTFTPVHNYQAPDGIDVVKYFGIPSGATPTLNGINRVGSHPLWYNTTDSSLYIYTGHQWTVVGTGGRNNVLAGYLMVYAPNDSTLAVDTTALFNVALRKSFADSVAYRTVSFPDSTGYWEINNNGDTILTHYFVGGGGGTGGSGVQSVTGSIVDNTDPLNPVVNAISQSQLKDSTSNIRASIPSQFNPIAGTGISLSGTYPNITFNSTASGGISSVSANAPLSVTNPTTTPNIVADTAKSQGKLATFNDVLTHKDSSALHYVSLVGDSLLVFGDLYGNTDTIGLSALNIWNRNGNTIYYNLGNVGIGTDTPYAKLVVRKDNLGNVANSISDSSGVMLFNATQATSTTTNQSSPPLTFRSYGWNTTTGLSYDSRIRLRSQAPSNSVYTYPSIVLDGSSDGGKTYTPLIYLSSAGLNVGGNSLADPTHFSNISQLNTNVLTTASISSSSYFANFGGGTYTNDVALKVYSTNRGVSYPNLTKAQRDSINLVVTSVTVTNAGTGYTSAPTVTFSTSKLAVSTYPAIGTATLSGSTLGSISISQGGSYNGIPAITLTGGGGSGATAVANVTQVLTTSLTIFCTDCTATDGGTGTMQYWNGTTWKSF